MSARILSRTVLLSCTLFLAGCVIPSTSSLDIEKGDVGGFVIGIQPADVKIRIIPGQKKDNTFTTNPLFFVDKFSGVVEEGYIVSRAKDGERFAILQICSTVGLGDTCFGPCGGSDALTFVVEKNKLLYLGDFTISFADGKVNYALDYDVDAATQYVRSAYPEFTGELVQHAFEPLRRWKSCSSVTFY